MFWVLQALVAAVISQLSHFDADVVHHRLESTRTGIPQPVSRVASRHRGSVTIDTFASQTRTVASPEMLETAQMSMGLVWSGLFFFVCFGIMVMQLLISQEESVSPCDLHTVSGDLHILECRDHPSTPPLPSPSSLPPRSHSHSSTLRSCSRSSPLSP